MGKEERGGAAQGEFLLLGLFIVYMLLKNLYKPSLNYLGTMIRHPIFARLVTLLPLLLQLLQQHRYQVIQWLL